ncbi:MAG: short-chain dehydrogenase [Shinella sp.]|nr:MAG: short-chain dehydrogenase [Shinella sp.]
MKRFTDKVVLVSGGNSGIGLAIAERFATEGAHLVLMGRDRRKGEAAISRINTLGATCKFVQVDLCCETSVKDEIAQLDRLDVLVNNAGLGTRRIGVRPEDTPGERWNRWRGANLDSTYYMTAHCKPLLGASGGCVVNISSTGAIHGNWGLYGVAKAGVEALTRSFAAEAAPVRVNAISPGWIATEATALASGNADGSWDLPPSLLNRVGTGAEIAGVAAFLASEDASFITGQTLVVDGGMSIMDFPSFPLLENAGSSLFSSN